MSGLALLLLDPVNTGKQLGLSEPQFLSKIDTEDEVS